MYWPRRVFPSSSSPSLCRGRHLRTPRTPLRLVTPHRVICSGHTRTSVLGGNGSQPARSGLVRLFFVGFCVSFFVQLPISGPHVNRIVGRWSSVLDCVRPQGSPGHRYTSSRECVHKICLKKHHYNLKSFYKRTFPAMIRDRARAPASGLAKPQPGSVWRPESAPKARSLGLRSCIFYQDLW